MVTSWFFSINASPAVCLVSRARQVAATATLDTGQAAGWRNAHEKPGGHHAANPKRQPVPSSRQDDSGRGNRGVSRDEGPRSPEVHRRSGHPIRIFGPGQPRRRPRAFWKRQAPPLQNCLCFREGSGRSPADSLPLPTIASRKLNNRLAALRRRPRNDLETSPPVTRKGRQDRRAPARHRSYPWLPRCRAGARRSLPRGPSSTQGRDTMVVGASIPACHSVPLRSPPSPAGRGRFYVHRCCQVGLRIPVAPPFRSRLFDRSLGEAESAGRFWVDQGAVSTLTNFYPPPVDVTPGSIIPNAPVGTLQETLGARPNLQNGCHLGCQAPARTRAHQRVS